MISIGMGEIKLSSDPEETLCALGLGSCIGVAMYDPGLPLAGMCHIVLPSSGICGDSGSEPGRYADTGIPELLRQMESAGATKSAIGVVVAGGAELFKMSGKQASVLNIGHRNSEAVRAALANLGLTVRAQDVGGNCGRSLSLNVADGIVTVRRLGEGDAQLADLSGKGERAGIERVAA